MTDSSRNRSGSERASSDKASDRADRASADTAEPQAASVGMAERLGNQGMQALLQTLMPGSVQPRRAAPKADGTKADATAAEREPDRVASGNLVERRAEPAQASAVKRAMGASYGMNFDRVRLRTDDAAAQRAEAVGARAYTQGDEIGFARGVFDPNSVEGKRTIAHEFAHVAQRAGGNTGSALPAMPDTAMAEWQANDAAASVLAGQAPRVSAFAGTHALYDDPDQNPGPTAATVDDEKTFKIDLKILETQPDTQQRSRAIKSIVELAMKAGPVQGKATQKVIDLLKAEPIKNFSDHHQAVTALQSWLGKDAYRVYEFLLYGRFYFADHSKNELGSALVVGIYQTWLHDGKGKYAIDFLRRKIVGDDKLKANLAARIVADLLELENTPEAQGHKANYAALRAMARENGWDSFGALGMASATPRIFSALQAMRGEAIEMERMVRLGPINDPLQDQDTALLNGIIGGLNQKGDLTVPNGSGGTKRIFTAENREETEHAVLDFAPATNVAWLQDMAQAFTIAVDAGVRIQARIAVLHENAEALDTFLGNEAAKSSDERNALFDLRHEYIETWLSVTGSTFGNSNAGLAGSYQARLDMVDHKFEYFDEVVAVRKFKSTRERFKEYSRLWNDGVLAYSNTDGLADDFYFQMKETLATERKSISERMATGFSANVGGTIVRLAPSDDYIPTDLRMVSRMAQDTSLFGLQSAVFLIYATSLSVHGMMIKSDVGSSGFQKTQGKRLTDMREALRKHWQSGDFEGFIAKTDSYEATLKQVVEAIKDRAKIDLLLNLAITLVAALVTSGAALAVRVAALSETLALARTARAISSMSMLFEAGVFTATELTMRSAVFDKDITALGALKSAATNLAFMGAMKAVGKFAEPLAQGSPLRQLMMGHLVGFAGVSAVSATMGRIETGHWPDDVAAFLAQTAVTYLLIAGVQHGFNKLVATPTLKAAAETRLTDLKTANEALYQSLRGKVDRGELSKAEFEAIRAERVRILEETKAIAKVLKEGGAMTAAEYAAIEKMTAMSVAEANGAAFPLTSATAPDAPLKALPAPESVIELSRVGNTDTYVYDPTKPTANIETMLTRYVEKGFKVEGTPALRRVVDPSGRTRFLLSGAPISSPRLLHAGSAAKSPTLSPVERASGLSGDQAQPARQTLARINREIETKLPAEYPDHIVLATMALLLEQAAAVSGGMPIDAVRGVADALALERGIPYSAVRRLFMTVEPKALSKLFADYHDIVNSPKVASGSRYLIADDLLPKSSRTLIDTWRKLQENGIELPADMDLRAVRGLLRQVEKMPGGWMQWLKGIAKEKRGEKLRAVSGLTDPRIRLPENVTELLASIAADVRPGINPLSGADGDAFVASLEAQPGAGKFAEPILRLGFVSKVNSLRMDVAELQQGRELKHGNWEQIVGRANEVRQISALLSSGATIQASDRDVGPKGPLPNINLADVTLPSGAKLDNAPTDKNVHIDLLFTEAGGTLVALEMTSAELGLPGEFAALDPQNAAYGKNIDWAVAELNKGKTDVRKFMQMVKIYQLNKVATALGTAWSGQPVNPASMRIRAGDFTVPAARAIENLGFQMELNDGTRQTAAQVEARKKTK